MDRSESKKEPLTNESIRGKFTSQFELVNYAIKLADQMIRSGRAPRVSIDNQNPAVIIVDEIDEGKDHFDDVITVASVVISEPKTDVNGSEKKSSHSSEKPQEKKKPRRILA